jgi:hypothetical protein
MAERSSKFKKIVQALYNHPNSLDTGKLTINLLESQYIIKNIGLKATLTKREGNHE